MTIRITDWLITSDKTPQCAAVLDPDQVDSWTVSWLPTERRVHRDQVVTAVLLAEQISTRAYTTAAARPLLEELAGELDLTAAEAIDLVAAADLLVLEGMAAEAALIGEEL